MKARIYAAPAVKGLHKALRTTKVVFNSFYWPISGTKCVFKHQDFRSQIKRVYKKSSTNKNEISFLQLSNIPGAVSINAAWRYIKLSRCW